MNRALMAAGVALAIAVLGGCAESRSELENYIASVKQRPGRPLPPLPKMQEFESFEYAAQDLRDPFSRVSSEQASAGDVAVAATGKGPDLTRRKEELESYPLDALDMVGTMGGGEETFGLIKDPAGVVHRVKPSNYLGQNHGKILEVHEDRIELTEWFPNGLGGWEERRSAIALDDE